MTGNSRRHVSHHSAQKTIKIGLCSAESTKVEPSPRSSEKSGAAPPTGVVAGPSVVTVAGLDVVETALVVDPGAVVTVVVVKVPEAAVVALPEQAATRHRARAAAVLRIAGVY